MINWSDNHHKNCCIQLRNGGWLGRGLEAVRGSQRVYLEAYTSVLLAPKEQLVSVRSGYSWRKTILVGPFEHAMPRHPQVETARNRLMVAAPWAQEAFYGKAIIIADREMVESNSDDILAGAAESDVSFLVVGDPFGCHKYSPTSWSCLANVCTSHLLIWLYTGAVCHIREHLIRQIWHFLGRATTHTDLELRARKLGIPVRTIHNASIMNAVGVCGLQLYRFGEVRTLPRQLKRVF